MSVLSARMRNIMTELGIPRLFNGSHIPRDFSKTTRTRPFTGQELEIFPSPKAHREGGSWNCPNKSHGFYIGGELGIFPSPKAYVERRWRRENGRVRDERGRDKQRG